MTPTRLVATTLTALLITASCGSDDEAATPSDDPPASTSAPEPAPDESGSTAPPTAATEDVEAASESVATDAPSSEEVEAAPDTATAEPAAEEVEEAAPDESEAADPEEEVTDLAFAGGQLVAGERYSTMNLGVDIEFTAPRDLFVPFNRRSIVSMIDGYDAGQYLPETGVSLDFRRWSGWSTRDEASLPAPTASIDPYDVDAWLASNDLVLLSDGTTEIAGRPVRVFEVTVDPTTTVQAEVGTSGQCFAGWEPCFHIGADATGELQRYDWVSGKRITRFHLVTIEGSEPLLISVGAAPGSPWFDEVETVLETLEIGPDRPPLDPS